MSEEAPSGWAVGWAMFAATMLFISGFLQALAGLSAILGNDFYAVSDNYVFRLDASTWGWVHLLVGIVVFCCGLGILKGHVLGRTVGVFAAAGVIVTNFTWLPYSPVWSTILIAIGISVIWALTAHGRDITAGSA